MQPSRFLITGGSQGIGAAIVELARAAGHQVVFTGRNEQLIETVAGKTGAHGLRADVSVGDDNARTVEACLQRMGGIDVLVNNAGYAYRAEIGALDVDAMREMFDTNVFGLVDITNRVVPLMKAQGEGDIVNIASTSGMKGAATATAYGAQQVGGARHQPVLAGRAAAARHSRDLRVPVGGPDEFRRQRRPQQPEQALRRGHRRDDHGGARRCLAARCGRSWRCSPTTRGRKTNALPRRAPGRRGTRPAKTRLRSSIFGRSLMAM